MITERLHDAKVTRYNGWAMQVCVPVWFSDAQVVAFAQAQHSAGTPGGWFIRREGDPALHGLPERNTCKDPDRDGYVHLMVSIETEGRP